MSRQADKEWKRKGQRTRARNRQELQTWQTLVQFYNNYFTLSGSKYTS